MSSKILLIGQAPGKQRGEPLAGAAGRRLAALAGLDLKDFASRFEHAPPLDLIRPTRGMTVEDRAEIRAENIRRGNELRSRLEDRRVVLLGREVASAFDLVLNDDYKWFQALGLDPNIEAAVIPMPGGRDANWWNEPENAARAREFMLALKIGLFEQPRRRGKEKFSVTQVAAALEAGRGIYTWAARALAEATGADCSSQTIKNYVDKYPEQLGPIFERAQVNVAGMVVEGLVQKAEAGETQVLRDLADRRFLQDVVRDRLGIDLRKNVGVEHSGTVKHEVTVQVEEAWARIVAAEERDDREPVLVGHG